MKSNVAGIETASYEVVEVIHTTEALTHLFKGASVVLNTVGPFAKFGPDTFVVIEKWESMDHLKAHGASEHMKAYAAKNKDLLADRAVHVLQNA